jgi:hypothetical protein
LSHEREIYYHESHGRMKNQKDCAGEGQQQFTRLTDITGWRAVAWLWVVIQKNMVMSPMGPRTKNGCAGNGQQQFTQPSEWQDSLTTESE